MTVYANTIPGMPMLPPGAPGPSVGVMGIAGGAGVPGLPGLPPALTAPRFPATSRYSGIEIAVLVDASGRETPYLRRRFVPDPDSLAAVGSYAVHSGDRLDRIAARALGDPEQFWRLCDGNRALDPTELETPIGRVLRVTLPAGIQAAPGHA